MPVVSHSQGATSVLLNVGRFPFKLDFAHRRCDVPVSENRRDSLGSLGEDVIMAVVSLGSRHTLLSVSIITVSRVLSKASSPSACIV